MKNKKLEFEVFLNKYEPHVISICEHWLTDSEINACSFENYKLCNFYCRKSFKGGGVALYMSSHLNPTPVNLHLDKIDKVFEYTAGKFTLGTTKCIFLSIYRSPDNHKDNINFFLDKLDELLYTISCKYDLLFLAGDFNINLNETTTNSTNFLDVTCSYNLYPMNKEITRLTSRTLLDNIFSNYHLRFNAFSVNCEFSDHAAVFIDLNRKCDNIEHNVTFKKRFYSANNQQTFHNLLSCENWEQVYKLNDTNDKFIAFLNIMLNAFYMAFPEKTVNNKVSCKTWITEDIRRTYDKLNNLHWLYKASSCEVVKFKYNSLKRIYKKQIRDAKVKWNDNKIRSAKNPSKAAWQTLNNNIRSKPCNQTISIKLNEEIINDPSRLCNTFANFFVESINSKVNTLKNNIKIKVSNCNNSFFLKPCSQNEIYNAIVNVSKKKSSGPDGIPCFVIKNIAHIILAPLENIINCSFENGVFPDFLKIAKIIPLHKKGERDNINNYRSIANLSVFSKIFEKLMYERLLNFFLTFNLFSDSQHGFIKGKSIDTALFSTINYIYGSLDSNGNSLGTFYDFSRAFDVITREVLESKLTSYGIFGPTRKWIMSYLSNRKQYVELTSSNTSKVSSDTVDVHFGVPQGGILSPLLFIIFCNDLPKFCNIENDSAHMCQYADDTSIIINCNKLDTSVIAANKISNLMSRWCSENGVILNPEKSVFIHFINKRNNNNNPQLPTPIVIDNVPISNVDQTKFLGITIDSELSWNHHINNLVNKLSSSCYLVNNLKNVVQTDTILLYINACVMSHISFGILIWGSSPEAQRILILQKRLIRILARVNPREHAVPYFKRYKLMSVFSLYYYKLLLYVRQNLVQFQKNSDINCGMQTRYSNKLNIPQHKTRLYERSPLYIGIKAYNHLPNDLVNVKTFKEFKSLIKNFFLENVLYHHDDFFKLFV